MNARETSSLLCPFCGAPQSRLIPADAVQVKCQYCGGIFLVQPEIGGFRYRCVNHPDRLSMGLCNDCGKGFCKGCLHPYQIEAKGEESALLYLCPNCLRSRVVSKANRNITGGGFLLILGIVIVLLTPWFASWFGILFILFGLTIAIYGFYDRWKKVEELSLSEKSNE